MYPNLVPVIALAVALASGSTVAEERGYASLDPSGLSIAKFELADKNGDGFLTLAEAGRYEMLKNLLSKADTNRDGRLSRVEYWVAAKGEPWG